MSKVEVQAYTSKEFKFMGWDQEYEMKIQVNAIKDQEVRVYDGFQYSTDYLLFNLMLEHSLSVLPHPNDYPNLRLHKSTS